MENRILMSTKLAVLFGVVSEHSLLFLAPIVITYQIEHICVNSSPSLISYYIGLQEGLSRLLSAVGVIFWTSVSDKIGRKYSLIITMSGIATSSIAGGLCTTYSTLLFWRGVSGLFSGTIPIIKATISDISDDSNISDLYKFFASGYGFASILGPLIGGLFSQPYNLNSIFDKTFFHDYPYFLPFCIHACISINALIFVSLKIPFKPLEKRLNTSYKLLCKNKNFLSITAIFFFHGFVQFSYRTLISLWLKTDKALGGIGWKSEISPGMMNALSGVFVAFVPFMLNPIFSRKLKPVNSILFLNLILIPFLLLMSCSNALSSTAQWFVLVVCNGSIVAFITMGTSFISICITNSLSIDIMGKGIGVSQAFTSISRSISATLAALIYGTLESKKLSFPFDTHFLFICICLILLFNVFLIKYLLSKTLNNRLNKSEHLNTERLIQLTTVSLEDSNKM